MKNTAQLNTAKVTGRRQLRFESVEDIQADVELLASSPKVRALGNWTEGQIYDHIATILNKSIDGFEFQLPWLLRMAASLIKKRFLIRPMSAGHKLPKKAYHELVLDPRATEESLQNIRTALERFRVEEKRASHPFFGKMTKAETIQLQCRHCEMHLSFLVPE